jgi:hypothetical protein
MVLRPPLLAGGGDAGDFPFLFFAHKETSRPDQNQWGTIFTLVLLSDARSLFTVRTQLLTVHLTLVYSLYRAAAAGFVFARQSMKSRPKVFRSSH